MLMRSVAGQIRRKMTGGAREMDGVCSMAKHVVLCGDALASFPSSHQFREVRYFNLLQMMSETVFRNEEKKSDCLS